MDLQRPPKSAAEIAALPPLGTTECAAHVRTNGGGFSPETLVYLLREAEAQHDSPFFELCGRLLIGRRQDDGRWVGGHCEGIIINRAVEYGLNTDPGQLLEFRARCHSGMWLSINAGRAAKKFWEERFGRALRCVCIDCARSIIRQRAHRAEEQELRVELTEDTREADSSGIQVDEEVLSRLSGPIHEAALLGALRRLPERQAQAVLLAWVERRPIESKYAPSVSSIMQVTPRAVYKLLEKAGGTLQADPAVRKIWFGEA